MKLTSLVAAAALAGAVLAGSAASAVTFSVSGGDAYTLPGNYNPTPGSPDITAGAEVRRNGVLSLDGPGKVTFSYAGTEAGYHNRFTAGSGSFDNKSGPNNPFTLMFGAGALPFAFSTESPAGSVANGASTGYYKSIALFQKSASVVFALFNDGATSDKDYDDMVVRMEVAPVPLPAAAWLLIAGLGGLGAVARRRAATA